MSNRQRNAARILGILSLITLGLTAWLGLVVTPPDAVQDELVRIIYIHPAVAWMAYQGFGLAALSSLLYLFKRTRSQKWDYFSAACVEVGVVFCALALVTGGIWGRPTWGAYWTWDARLTTTALLLALFAGCIALRQIPSRDETRAKRFSVAVLVAAIDIPIVHMSVEWWRTLHQGRTLLNTSPTIHGSQLATMLLSVAAFTFLFAWLVMWRYQLEKASARREVKAIEAAVEERRGIGVESGALVR